ncbi:MAG: hypothetical protein ACK4QW_16455 [Alphaproteobacteria bacterium]
MPFKPNYKHLRNERARSKEQKKQEKAARKAARTTDGDGTEEGGEPQLDGDDVASEDDAEAPR